MTSQTNSLVTNRTKVLFGFDTLSSKDFSILVPGDDPSAVLVGGYSKEEFVSLIEKSGMIEAEGAEGYQIQYRFPNNDFVELQFSDGQYYQLGRVEHWALTYGEFSHVEEIDGKGSWYTNQTQYFATIDKATAFKAFTRRLVSEYPGREIKDSGSMTLENIAAKNAGDLTRLRNHYDYLYKTIGKFWDLVFNTENALDKTFCAGIVSAHGDKGYDLKSKELEEGIPFNHAMLLFLLTYTNIRENKDTSRDGWVVKNYPRFLKNIYHAELEALSKEYGITKLMPYDIYDRQSSDGECWGEGNYIFYKNGLPVKAIEAESIDRAWEVAFHTVIKPENKAKAEGKKNYI